MNTMNSNLMVNGIVQYGFDYNYQVWVKDFIVQECGHTDYYRTKLGGHCCNGYTYRNHDIRDLYGHRDTHIYYALVQSDNGHLTVLKGTRKDIGHCLRTEYGTHRIHKLSKEPMTNDDIINIINTKHT